MILFVAADCLDGAAAGMRPDGAGCPPICSSVCSTFAVLPADGGSCSACSHHLSSINHVPCFPTTHRRGDYYCADTHAAMATSCKAESVMRSALALSFSEWYVLLDDDTAVRLRLADVVLSRYSHKERLAFGLYPCGGARCDD